MYLFITVFSRVFAFAAAAAHYVRNDTVTWIIPLHSYSPPSLRQTHRLGRFSRGEGRLLKIENSYRGERDMEENTTALILVARSYRKNRVRIVLQARVEILSLLSI